MKRRSTVYIITMILLVALLPLPPVAAQAIPAGPAEILELYRAVADRARAEKPGCTKTGWQTVGSLDITGNPKVDAAVAGVVNRYVTPQSAPRKESFRTGDTAAVPACTLTDVSQIVSAECERTKDNRLSLRLVLADENTPRNPETSVLAQITDLVTYKRDVDRRIREAGGVLRPDYGLLYRGFTVECECTTDGRLIYLQHHADILVTVRSAVILVVPVENKTIELSDNVAYYDFDYPPQPPVLKGDVNDDGAVTAEDARLALRAAVGLDRLIPGFPRFTAADYNEDEALTAADARAILRLAVGLPPLDDADAPPPDAKTAAAIEAYRTALEAARAAQAGYTRLTWQKAPTLNPTGISAVDDLINGEIAARIAPADRPDRTAFEQGEAAAKNLPPFTLTDFSRIVSASVYETDGVTTVTLVLADETDPKGGESFLGQVTNNLIFREDIDRELSAVSALTAVSDFHVTYKNLTLTAAIRPDGTLQDLRHHIQAEISVNRAEILRAPLVNQLVTMESDIHYCDFQYGDR